MWALSVILLVISASAAPVNLNFQVTPSFIDNVCAKLQDPSKASLTLKWAVDPMCSLTAEQKQDVSTFANNFHSGKYPVPHTREEFATLLKEQCSSVYPIFESIMAEAISRWKQLKTQGSKDFIAKWEKKSYEDVDSDRAKMFCNVMTDGKDMVKDLNALTSDDWATIKEQFEPFYNIYKSDKAQALMSLIENLPDNFDCQADQDAVNKAMEMSLAEFLPQQSN